MSQRSRSDLFQGLSEVVNEEAVGEMLSYFPARDVEEPVNKENLRAEMADLRTELHVEMAGLRTELHVEMAGLRTELADLRVELRGDMADLRVELTTLLHTQIQASMRWMIGTMVTLTSLILLAIALTA